MPTPAYIAALREVWGHRQLLLPGVSGVVVRGEPGREQVLLGRRADTGRWSVPAGIVEPGEQPADCLVRELWEETRVRVSVERLAAVIADDPLTYPNGDVCQFISLTFRCRYLSGEATVGDEESLAVAWFGLTELPSDLSERGRGRIAAALSTEPACQFLVGDPWSADPGSADPGSADTGPASTGPASTGSARIGPAGTGSVNWSGR